VLVTQLTPQQFTTVAGEIAAMLAADERDEAWRVLKMFTEERFNYRLDDFPADLQTPFATLGTLRRRDYAALLREVRALAGSASAVFEVEEIGELPCDDRRYALVKVVSRPPASPYATRLPICFVAGIHGDEADGVLGTLELARRFTAIPELVSTYSLTIYPCLNPVGYERMTRENGSGKDLNREFLSNSGEIEVQIMERELRRQQFTGFISGHSDFESFGIYAYATGAVLSERLAKPALFQASGIIPINTDPVIDGHPAQYGIINKKFDGSLGPLTRGATEPFDITIETPNLFALRKRVEAQAIAFETILHEYRAVAAEGMYL
jgi:protein MpaA